MVLNPDLINTVSKQLADLLSSIPANKKSEIGELIFDVFGFSRGASAARLFYRRLFMDNSLNDENQKNNVKVESYKIRFYGLFDTVLSYSNSSNIDISLKLCSSPCTI